MDPITILTALKAFGSFFARNWKPILICGAVLIAWLYVSGLKSTIADQAQKISDLNLQYSTLDTTCKANADKLQSAIDQQNDSIKKLNDALNDANAKIKTLKYEQAKRDKENQRKLDELLKHPVATDCPGAINYLIDVSGDLKWTK